MMETLNQTILNECREEVAKEYGFADWKECFLSCHWTAKNDKVIEESALLAMDRQWSFSMWIRSAGYKKMSDSRWANRRTFEKHSTEELYDIWRREQK